MFTASEAEQLIFTLVTPLDSNDSDASEVIDIRSARHSLDCLGRILSASVRSSLDFPHWDNSAMDGYAVRAEDVQQTPVTLSVVEEIPAGQHPQKTIESGQAARIFTGAMMPLGADTVVMQENTTREEITQEKTTQAKSVQEGTAPTASKEATDSKVDQTHAVTVLQPPSHSGAFVRRRGDFYRSGNELLPVGRVISPAEIALLSAAQQTQVNVYRRIRVAVLSTGNELVTLDQTLNPGQIIDSNQYALCALVAQVNALPLPLGIVKDSKSAVKESIVQALTQADIILSTGGVSVGDYDYIDEVLEELGATLHIRSVAVKPGKPLTVASFDSSIQKSMDKFYPSDKSRVERRPIIQPVNMFNPRPLYFGLPGNPASAMVGFWRFVAPAIAKLSGQSGPWSPSFVWAKTSSDLHAGGKRETYLWGQLQSDEQGFVFTQATGGHSSGNLVNLVNTSGLGVVPQGETQIEAGAPVRVLKIR